MSNAAKMQLRFNSVSRVTVFPTVFKNDDMTAQLLIFQAKHIPECEVVCCRNNKFNYEIESVYGCLANNLLVAKREMNVCMDSNILFS